MVSLLGGFHVAKCLIHSIRKYIKVRGVEDSLIETKLFGVKIAEQVLNGSPIITGTQYFSWTNRLHEMSTILAL